MSQSTIVALEAFEHVAPEHASAYEEAGVRIDNQVKDREPGMLVHALTRVGEAEAHLTYRWLEVFTGFDAICAHFENPDVIAHGARMNDGILAAPTDIVFYGGFTDTQRAELRKRLAGVNVSFAAAVTSFYRSV